MKKLLVLTAILGAFSAGLFAEENTDATKVQPVEQTQSVENADANAQAVAVEPEAEKKDAESK
ncbi:MULTISPECIES: hypothetical protein [unclassified Campylobacter]|uniref:hypothetical protein n=1 Tax=unclassified Campylobacter TaxID=2593542 RepID=UPI001BDAE888|nr:MULTISPECIES: hypothetical protein [unclassified Campylobacter]MBZ7975324.1 hypothetical protein [Campylobacter sp. RM12637]MBZ7978347.1 hypothetical protein [Campylobacter sp. RM12654]MBZ7979057.1 hypothetical protein [Campylobacter sp. RM12642]MBZ7981675.1 hypothetical protein [Campylobacter sp. RM12640]MBZ7983068.1 hypothetical protein [Campylobacter sp. RM12647]MBZ7988554.1 hypothetical protein [Campylobacter sp. RM12635]MBZ7990224.1 hypothetical protein [Campylobacter sp. RM9331]MBZ